MEFSNALKEAGPWAWSPDGTLLAACDSSRLVVRDTKTLMVVSVFSNLDVCNVVEWSRDGRYVLCAMYKRGIVQVCPLLPVGLFGIKTHKGWWVGEPAFCRHVGMLTDEKEVATFSCRPASISKRIDCSSQVWDVEDEEWACRIAEGPAGLAHCQWAPDGRQVPYLIFLLLLLLLLLQLLPPTIA